MNARIAVGLTLLTWLSGCSVQAQAGPGFSHYDSGTLVVDWTIQGRKDPALCELSDAETLDTIITWADGELAGEYQQSCRAFATSIELEPGTYRAQAVLLDFTGRERTTTVAITTFDIYGNDELDVPIDFSAASFY